MLGFVGDEWDGMDGEGPLGRLRFWWELVLICAVIVVWWWMWLCWHGDGVEADRAAASIRGNYRIIHGAATPLWLILHSVVYRKPEGRCRTFCA